MRTLPRSAVQVRATADGVLTYLVDLPPEELPPVRGRDLEAAWSAAGALARAERPGGPRVFRFRGRGGESVDLALTDPDACCWARAVDQTVGMGHSYGLSLCLRLLALVELLGRAAWAGGRAAIGGGPHPAPGRARPAGPPVAPAALRRPVIPSWNTRMTPTRPAAAFPPVTRRGASRGMMVALGLLSGCTFGGPPKPRTVQQQAVAACRTDADRAYLQQNRVLLSERSQRDTPFSSSGTVGITSEGLPQLYGRSSDFEACLRSHQVDGAARDPAVSAVSAPQMDPSYQP